MPEIGTLAVMGKLGGLRYRSYAGSLNRAIHPPKSMDGWRDRANGKEHLQLAPYHSMIP